MPVQVPAKSDAVTTIANLLFESATVSSVTGNVGYSKLGFGVADSFTLVSTTAGLPVQQQGTWTVTVQDGGNVISVDDAGSTLSIDDGGGSITVDGTVALSGAVDTELPAAATLADNTSNPTVPGVGAFGMVFDGSTWDRLPGTAADGVLVNLGANNDVTVTGTVTANAGTGTFTVAGTVTANAGTGTFLVDQADTATADYDTGAGTVNQTMLGIALPGSGGPVAGGTSTNPVRVDPTGTTTQPVSGTVTANAGSGTFTVAGTVTANAGTGTFAVQDNASKGDNTAFTPGTDRVLMIGAEADETTPNPVDEGDAGALRMTLSRALHVNVRDDAGDSAMDGTNNALRVNVVAGSAGGPSKVDDAAFTVATDSVSPMGALADETTPDSVDEGDVGIPRMTLTRKLYSAIADPVAERTATVRDTGTNDSLNVAIVDASGNQITAFGGSGGTSHSDDAAFTIGGASSVTPFAALADETTPDSVDEGDVGVVRMTLNRKLYAVLADPTAERSATVRDTGTNDSLNVAIVDASGNQITSFGGGTQFAEDAAHVSGDLGTVALAVRRDTPAVGSGLDGDYSTLNVNSTGRLYTSATIDAALPTGANTIGNVNAIQSGAWTVTANAGTGTFTVAGTVTANAGTGTFATSDTATLVDDAAFTPATSRVLMVGATFDDTTPDSVNEGDGGAVRMSANRNLYTTLRDAAGNERGANVNASNQLTVSVDNTVTVGTHAVTQSGTWNVASITANVVPGTAAADLGKAEDAVHASGDTGVMLLGVRRDTAASGAGADGDYATLNLNSTGRLYTSTTIDAAIPAGTNNIGDVDVLTLPSLPAGTNNIGDVDVLSLPTGASAAQVQGTVAHDAAAANNPVLIAARANLNEPTAVADADVTHLWADRLGRLIVLAGHANPEAPVTLNATASGDTTVIAAPGASLSLYICKVSVHNRAATNRVVALRDGTAGTIRWRAELSNEGGGSVIDFGSRGWQLTANTLLAVNLDAAGDVDVNVTEYYIAA